jgi:archaellum biogenesis protein FlaJ (TadC family)
MIKHKSILYFLIVLSALFLVVIIPSIIPFQTPEQQNETKHENDITSQTATATSIYHNNMIIAGLTLVPYVGWGYLFYALWNTGLVVASYHQPWWYLFMNPFAWIELSIYSYALLQSLKILHLLPQYKANDFWYTLIRKIAYTIVFMALALLASAIVEYLLISRVLVI